LLPLLIQMEQRSAGWHLHDEPRDWHPSTNPGDRKDCTQKRDEVPSRELAPLVLRKTAAAFAEPDQFAQASVAVAKHASGGRPHQEHPGVLSHTSGAKTPEQSGGAVVLVGATGSAAEYHIWLRPAAPSE